MIGAMSKRGQEMTSSDGSSVAKVRPTNLVMQGQCKEGVSTKRLRSLVNLGNDNNNRKSWSRILAQTLKLKVPKCIDKRRSI